MMREKKIDMINENEMKRLLKRKKGRKTATCQKKAYLGN